MKKKRKIYLKKKKKKEFWNNNIYNSDTGTVMRNRLTPNINYFENLPVDTTKMIGQRPFISISTFAIEEETKNSCAQSF